MVYKSCRENDIWSDDRNPIGNGREKEWSLKCLRLMYTSFISRHENFGRLCPSLERMRVNTGTIVLFGQVGVERSVCRLHDDVNSILKEKNDVAGHWLVYFIFVCLRRRL